MSEGRILVNKHYDAASAITAEVFTSMSSTTNDYKKGEIIVVNEKNNENLYILNSENEPVAVGGQVSEETIKAILKSIGYDQWFGTLADYMGLVASGLVSDNCTYYIYEGGEEPEPVPEVVISGGTMTIVGNVNVTDGKLIFGSEYTGVKVEGGKLYIGE